MSHLSQEQLSAHADGALSGRALEQAEHHLAGCRTCRDELARIARETEALATALEHDPGEAYFASFADRVAARIASAPAVAAAPVKAPRGPWWSPARIAWAGGFAAVAVGVAIVAVIGRQTQPDLAGTMAQAVPPAATESAPSADAFRESDADAGAARQESVAPPATEPAAPSRPAPGTEARDGVAATRARVTDARAHEVREGPGGEIVPVNPSRPFERAKREAPPLAVKEGEGVTVRKPRVAEPLATGEAKSAAPLALRQDEASEARGLLCGTVVDDRGRVVTGAQVVLTDLGLSVSTDRAGRFCISAPPGTRTLNVLAVGFQPLRRTVTLDAATPELALALHPVAVLDAPLALGTAPKGDGERALAPAPATSAPLGAALESAGRDARANLATPAAPDPGLAAFAQAPDSVRALAREAQRVTVDAAARRSAAQFDAAAVGWEKVVRNAQGAAEIEARRRLAEARFRAWETAPSTRRALAAQDALTAFIARAPAGRVRDQAAVWLDRVKH